MSRYVVNIGAADLTCYNEYGEYGVIVAKGDTLKELISNAEVSVFYRNINDLVMEKITGEMESLILDKFKISIETLFQGSKSYRTPINSLDGLARLPSIGSSLLLTSSTFESGGIITSTVEDVNYKGDTIYVRTINNVYVITILGLKEEDKA